MLRIARILIASLISASAAFGQGAPEADPSEAAREIVRRMSRAAANNDHAEFYAAMAELWTVDAKRAGQTCVDLINRGQDHQKPMAMDLLGRNATAGQLIAVVDMLSVSKFPDERRWLLRRAGTKEDASLDMLRPFLRDQDKYVQISAILAMADLGEVEAMRDLARSIPPPPGRKQNWDGQKSDMVAMARYGAVRTLTGLRPESSSDVRRWLTQNARTLDELTPPTRPDPAESCTFDDDELTTPSLDIVFAAEGYGEVVKSSGVASWAEFAVAMERAVDFARAGAEPVFGRIHLPAIELILADRRSIARYGGTSQGYLGFALGNRISMMFRDWLFVQGTLAHEYIHIIHSAHYEDQPRWLSEGLAESLTRSMAASAWKRTGPNGERRPVRTGRGFCRSVVRWDSAGNTNENPALYSNAHLFTDYLRFGFVAGDARLACLMGRLSRGETSERAIEAVYGVSVEEMDAGLDEWLGD